MNVKIKSQRLIKSLESKISGDLQLYIAHNILCSVASDVCLVGGCVRDLLLDITPKDYDFVCSGDLDEISQAFSDNKWKVSEVGKQFLVMKVSNPTTCVEFDIAVYRKDATYTDGRRPDYTEIGDIFDDCNRRDFTINALYLNLTEMVVFDPTGYGIDDLSSKPIRFVGKAEMRIREDYLRVFRAYRFSNNLKFEIAPQNLTTIRRLFNEAVTRTSPERIRIELEKMVGV
jgi:tRNA nucleotidyltransferase/poly(A) polymerase